MRERLKIVRSLVGLLPLITVEVFEDETLESLPGFYKRLAWFLRYFPDLAQHITHCEQIRGRRMIALPSRERLVRMLRTMLDEDEFLSPHGIRSLSKFHEKHPYEFSAVGAVHRVEYVPGVSDSGPFGGNFNWRGPVWFPLNYLIIEAPERYHHFYGDELKVEFPTGSANFMNLDEVARELARRLSSIFLPDGRGGVPATARSRAGLRIRTGGTCSFFTSIFTARRAGDSARATRPAGPPCWSG